MGDRLRSSEIEKLINVPSSEGDLYAGISIESEIGSEWEDVSDAVDDTDADLDLVTSDGSEYGTTDMEIDEEDSDPALGNTSTQNSNTSLNVPAGGRNEDENWISFKDYLSQADLSKPSNGLTTTAEVIIRPPTDNATYVPELLSLSQVTSSTAVPLQEPPAGIPSPTSSTCTLCGKTFSTVRDQWEHFMLKCALPPEYHCPKFLCSFVSEHSSDIKTHIATMHDKQAKFLLSCLDY